MEIPNPEEEKNSWDVDGKHLSTGTNYSPFGFDKNGHDRRGFDESRTHKITHEKWDEEYYDYRSFHKKTEINKYTGTKYNIFNVDQKGFDHEHKYVGIFNKKINANASTEITHYDLDGLNFFGFDENGFDKDDIHKNGTKFDDIGFDVNGFDSKYFNRYGNYKETTSKYDDNGHDQHGFNIEGFDNDGNHVKTKNKFNTSGFDAEGNHKDTFTKFDKNGFDKDDIHKNGTKFGDHGRDKYGFNADKRDANGYDTGGLDAKGLDSKGFDAMGIHCITGTRFDKNEKDWKGNTDNLLNDGSLKIIFKINGYEILHEDAYCVFAKHLNFQNTVFCLKIFSNQFNSIFITESRLSVFLKHFNHKEENILESKLSSNYNSNNFRDGSLTDFGWHAKSSKKVREDALLEKIISDGRDETLDTLNFLSNMWPKKIDVPKEWIDNIRLDIDFVLSSSSRMMSSSKEKLDECRNDLFKKYPKFERDYKIPSLMLTIKINKK